MRETTLRRVALLLAATGVVSTGTMRFFRDGGADRLGLDAAFAVYVGLVSLAVAPRPPRWGIPLAFVLVASQAVWNAGGESPVATAIAISATLLLAWRAPGLLGSFAPATLALLVPAIWLLDGRSIAPQAPVVVAALIALALVAAAFGIRSSGEVRLARVGLALLAVACVALAADRHLSVASLGVAPDDVLLVLVVVALFALAFSRTSPARRDVAVCAAALVLYAAVGMALVLGKSYHADVVAIPHRAIEHLLAGQDPYRATDAQEALVRFGLDPMLGTRLEDGSFLHSLNYPALAVLVPAPFVALGVADLRVVYLAEVVLLFALLLARAASVWRPFVAAALVGNVVIERQDVLAGTDPLWALLVASAWLFRDRAVLSAVALGLAAADRQPAWFVVPFYLVSIARVEGPRDALRRAALALAAFLLPSVPFLVDAPVEYLTGILAPLFAPLVANGVGIIGFSLDGPLPLLPRLAYTVASALALLALGALVWARERALRSAAAVLPFLPLYLAWRSLQNYFAFLGAYAFVDRDADAGPSRAEPK